MRVAVTGASGFIGSALVPRLRAGGHDVVRLVRRTPQQPDEISWDPAHRTLDPAALTDVDAVVHLAGAGVADHRWTSRWRQEILGSRVDGTATIAAALAAAPARDRVLLSGSAVGFYGDTGDRVTDESGPRGAGFLADVCGKWEAATAAAAGSARVVHLRTGIVLSASGGALRKQLPVFKACAGAPLGSGTQWVPWVSLDDELAAIEHCLVADVSGPVNLVAPHPVTNKDFTKALGKALHRPTLPVGVPGPLLTAALGDFAKEGLLAGQRLVPRALQDSGFAFAHPDLGAGLAAAL